MGRRIWRAFLAGLEGRQDLQWIGASSMAPLFKESGAAVGMADRGKGTKGRVVSDGQSLLLRSTLALAPLQKSGCWCSIRHALISRVR